MIAIFLLGTTAFLLCLGLTPLLRDIFIKLDIVDRPDGQRKLHSTSVPRMGGIPIVVAYAGALGLVYLFAPNGARIYIQHGALLRSLLPATALVFLTGLLDDIFSLKPWQKLAGQVAASILAVAMGAHLNLIHHAHWLSLLLSVIWLVGCANAVNLIDGMDGLATGVGLVATITTLLVAILTGNLGLAMATVPLAGCLLAFLRYNFTPASVFLGDCGSLTIGFILGCFGLIWSQRSGTLLGMAAPVMALALPLIDVSLAIGRRYLRRTPIFKGDRSHIHHMVQNLGFSTRGAALILYAFCAIFAGLALLESYTNSSLTGFIVTFCCLVAVIGISRLRYPEVGAVLRNMSHKVMRRNIEDDIYLGDLDRALATCTCPEQCWHIVRAVCEKLAFASAHLLLDGEHFEKEFSPASAVLPLLKIQLSLGERGLLSLTRDRHSEHPRLMMAVLHHLQEAITIEAQRYLHEPSSSMTTAA